MVGIKDALEAFLSSPEGVAFYGVLILALADFVLGTFAAFRDGTFSLDAVAAFLRKHIAGRVAPIAFLLALGYYAGQPALSAIGAAGAAAYTLETIGSIRASWGSNRNEQPVPKD